MKYVGVIAIMLVFGGMGGYALFRHSSGKNEPVKFAIVWRGNITIESRETGKIEPLVKVIVKSKVAGRVVELRVDEGDIVRAGDLIARIDPTELQREVNQVRADLEAAKAHLRQALLNWRLQGENAEALLEQAEADLQASESNLKKLKAGARPQEIASAEADVAKAQARVKSAERHLERQRRLHKQGLISLRQAEGSWKEAQANLDKLKAGFRAEEVAEAQANAERAKALLKEAESQWQRQKELFQKGLIARKQAEAEHKAALANLERAKAALENAKSVWERKQSLAEKGFLSKHEADLAQTQFKQAKKEKEAAQAQLERAEAALEAANFSESQALDAAEAHFKAAQQEYEAVIQRLNLVKSGSRSEDIRAMQAEVERAEAALEAARATEAQVIDDAELQLDVARKEHRSALERLNLLKAGARPEEIEAAQAQVERAKVVVRNAKANLAQRQFYAQQVVAARAQVARLLETLANVQTQLNETVIRAPISGIVIHRAIEPGELITSGISAFTTGQEIVTIANLSQLILKVRVNEVDVAKLRLGQRAEVKVDAYPQEVFIGYTSKIAPAAEENIKGAPTADLSEIAWFDVEVRLPNPDRRLKVGMTADVDIITARAKNTLCLPREAVVQEGRRFYAYVVRDKESLRRITEHLNRQKEHVDGNLPNPPQPPDARSIRTERVKLQVGIKDENNIQIKSGLRLGDVVVIKEQKKRRRFKMEELERHS